jgi:hypothetical protein
MTQVHLPDYHSAFNNGTQIAVIYQGSVRVWPAVVDRTASAIIAGRNVIVPHFDLVLTQGVNETFPPKWRTPQNTSDVPYTAGMPPYGFPLLQVMFRVDHVENQAGPVGLSFGVVPYDVNNLAATAQQSCFFSYAFNDVKPGRFYGDNVITSNSWFDLKPDTANFIWRGELTGATKIYLTNITCFLNW